MGRPAPRGLLQSGCSAAQARGSHRLPSRLAGLTKLALSWRFAVLDTFIINISAGLSTGKSRFFRLLTPNSRNFLPGQDADTVRHAPAAADAAGGTAFPPVHCPAVKGGAAQNDARGQQFNPKQHNPLLLGLFYHNRASLVCGICNNRSPSSGSSPAAGSGSAPRGNSWGSINPPSGRGSRRWTHSTGSVRLERVRLSRWTGRRSPRSPP